MRTSRRLAAICMLPLLVASACGNDDGQASDQPQVVVTTNVLGDVVTELLGDAASITVVMPVGANPHDFHASARQAAAMRDADILVVNGGGFEEGLLEVIRGAETDGVPVYEALSAVDILGLDDSDAHGHDEDEAHGKDDEHADDEPAAAHEDEHGGADPHFFTDPARMAAAAAGILDAVVDAVPELDTDAVRERAAAYIGELEALDSEMERLLEAIPDERRILVTNHEVFGYFADRYGFEVVGTVIPGGSTVEGAAAGNLADLIEVIEHEGVPAIFADTSSPADLARTLARDVGEVDVVELFSESLGEKGSGGETYVEMMRTNAERIATALS